MESIKEFLHYALPWVAIGLFLAIFFVRRSKNMKEDYGVLGMSLGLCIGTAIGVPLNSIGMGMLVGMIIGLSMGSSMKKEGKDGENK